MARVTRSELFAPDEIAIVHVVNRVVDLNPIRAAMAQTLEDSGHTSVQRRIQAEQAKGTDEHREERLSGAHQYQSGPRPTGEAPTAPDRFLSPLELDEQHGPVGACGSSSLGVRCSDKGFLPMSVPDYLELLDWTARQTAPGKCGSTPADIPPRSWSVCGFRPRLGASWRATLGGCSRRSRGIRRTSRRPAAGGLVTAFI